MSTNVMPNCFESSGILADWRLAESRRGHTFATRPLARQDTLLVANMLKHLSARTLWLRFFTPMPLMSEERALQEAVRLTQPRPPLKIALLATICQENQEEIVALAELFPDKDLPTRAELAVVVRDDYQGEGIGSSLMKQLIQTARRAGITSFWADTLSENRPIIQMWRKLGLSATIQTEHNLTFLQANLPD